MKVKNNFWSEIVATYFEIWVNCDEMNFGLSWEKFDYYFGCFSFLQFKNEIL